MDWAGQIANELFMGITRREIEEDGRPFVARVSTALRKAKAQGMMEAAQSLAPSDPALASDLIARASKIENPTLMTNTPMSERERELVEALREARKLAPERDDCGPVNKRVYAALRAYDPEPVPVIPAWEEFIRQNGPYGVCHNSSGAFRIDVGSIRVTKDEYERVRTLTSKAPTE